MIDFRFHIRHLKLIIMNNKNNSMITLSITSKQKIRRQVAGSYLFSVECDKKVLISASCTRFIYGVGLNN